MNKTETGAAVVKAAYVRPRIACFTAEYSLCSVSPIGGEHKPALPDPEGDLNEEDEP